MKKVFLFCVLALAFASCKPKATEVAPTTVDTTKVDTAKVDTVKAVK